MVVPQRRIELYYNALYDKGVKLPQPITREEQLLCAAIEHIRELEKEIEKLKNPT